jgi:DNA-binding MarR family transcriptional regulator
MDDAVPAGFTADLDLGPLTGSLGFLLRMAQLQNFRNFYEVLGSYGLRPGEFSVLWIIHRNPGIRQGLLAERLMIKRAHMTKLIRSFEDRGYVERAIPNDDRRTVELRLTPEGRSFVEGNSAAFLGHAGADADRLSAGEKAQLIALLQKYVRLEREAGG